MPSQTATRAVSTSRARRLNWSHRRFRRVGLQQVSEIIAIGSLARIDAERRQRFQNVLSLGSRHWRVTGNLISPDRPESNQEELVNQGFRRGLFGGSDGKSWGKSLLTRVPTAGYREGSSSSTSLVS